MLFIKFALNLTSYVAIMCYFFSSSTTHISIKCNNTYKTCYNIVLYFIRNEVNGL